MLIMEERMQRDAQFYTGQEVRIRDWQSMVDDFGVRRGDIPCRATFVSDMRKFCGREGKIKELTGSKVIIFNEEGEIIHRGYSISLDMIEPIQTKTSYMELMIE